MAITTKYLVEELGLEKDVAEKIFIARNGEIEEEKAKLTAVKAELEESKKALKTLNTEFEQLKTDGASGEEWKAKYEAKIAEIDAKEKQAEADRILAEKTADIEKRFNECVGDKEWSHDDVKAGYLKRFGDALENEQYKGKGDTEIFHDLTKDDERAFKGVQVVKLAGGNPNGNIGGVDDAKVRAIMGLPTK